MHAGDDLPCHQPVLQMGQLSLGEAGKRQSRDSVTELHRPHLCQMCNNLAGGDPSHVRSVKLREVG